MRRFVLLVAIVLAACSSGPDRTAPPSATAARLGLVEYKVENYQFLPLEAKTGDTIKLIDLDDEPHTFTSDAPVIFDVQFGPNDPKSLPAPAAGSYTFRCRNHPTMIGTLTVT